MLTPKKVLHRKWHKGRSRFAQKRASTLINVDFGDYGIKAMSRAWVTSRQLEAARRAIVRYMKKGGKIWTRVFPDKPITTKGTHFTMGSGKGSPDHFVAVVVPGNVVMEISGLPHDIAVEALTRASHKLPIKTRIVTKEK